MSGDAKFFARGKVEEFRLELLNKKDKSHVRKKETLKKVVANMTIGHEDMSPLFPAIIECMILPVIEIKKMCYLFVMNYARLKPDSSQLALRHLLRDLESPNPLLRALALRTISTVHVKEYVESLVLPIQQLLQDPDPYVRKTAAIGVAKLHGHDRKLVEATPMIEGVRDLLRDSNSTVVASALAALMDIADRSENIGIELNFNITNNLVAALNECSEWSQVYILESLMTFTPQNPGDAELIAERIAPRLQHANSGVVLTTVKVILYLTNYMVKDEDVISLCKKLSPPLVTLLSKSPELQFVAIRNAQLILEKRPEILQNDIKVFFCKYNDPIYVKLAKLEVIVKLANEDNIEKVLEELKEYATEVDVDFARKAVRSIGRLAVKIERTARRCISTLLELVSTKVSYVVQEATVVSRDILRKYPGQYESIISTLCENLDSLDEPESKKSIIWVIGQYASRIENADSLLEDFIYSLTDETYEVQLALLTATVKLFVARPAKGQDLALRVLTWATKEAENPDIRDRGFMYWRLLSTNLGATKQIVLSEKRIGLESENRFAMEEYIGTLASVYHKSPQQFIRGTFKPRTVKASPVLRLSYSEPDSFASQEFERFKLELSDPLKELMLQRPSNSELPLIAVPRLLHHYKCLHETNCKCDCAEEMMSLLEGIGYPLLSGLADNILSACQDMATCTILKFPPERVASSLVDLWEDLANPDSQTDFLKYHTGWIGHSVLLSVNDSSAVEAIERFIEIACCLDLLCQQHLLAFHTIRSLQTRAVRRLIAWDAVRQPLTRNMEEIVTGRLARGLDSNSTFRLPRDMLLEYWILSRPYVDEPHLSVESLTIQPPTSKSNDVETRIAALEAILDTIENTKPENYESEPESTGFDRLSTSDISSDLGSEFSDFVGEKSLDEQSDTDDLAKRTRARICIRLQELKHNIQQKVEDLGNQVKLETRTSPPGSRLRSVDPFDQRSIFRARARNAL